MSAGPGEGYSSCRYQVRPLALSRFLRRARDGACKKSERGAKHTSLLRPLDALRCACLCFLFFQKSKSAAAATTAAVASAAAHAAKTTGTAAAGSAESAMRRPGPAESTAHGRPGSARRTGRAGWMIMAMGPAHSHAQPKAKVKPATAARRRRRSVMGPAGSAGHQDGEKHHRNDDYDENFHALISFPSSGTGPAWCHRGSRSPGSGLIQ